ncbi:CinA family nicotinamide mononucleotide deamidase-related protein [Myxococcus sp. AM009]|uniref:CinA family nicotinamide mononucleotide deamidase-related protein n=1 Tax=unclassified Myxococcus TaxID=2648731 RepID=UPI0015951409|nr:MULTISPECIES: CinA family nicotinamide mononucleotide deamidase-related protein [unclassified Myxococcus]NVJ01244.1 CinA family nicotinamide mononucleotide deamidase-related protein [Myxococcus sp. AM009]NVJ13787.1 CinA family nicotinamide mononucleotide deamidase-related protein [Myxococcus sp. AM010]
MRVELLCTGDELVTGLITDTNSTYLEARLFDLGVKVERVVLVGDVRPDITQALKEAASRADVVVVSGGLGPTSDDFTLECAAEAAGVPLEEDAQVLDWLRQRYAARGLSPNPSALRMARVPRGSEPVRNPEGSAPLVLMTLGGAQVFFLPGVPREFKALLEGEVLPRIRATLDARPERTYRAFRLLRTVGIPESELDLAVAPMGPRHPRIVFGFRTHAPENHLKLMAEAPSQAEADAALAAVEVECRQLLGTKLFGVDSEAYAAVVLETLRRAGATLAVAESCTGGLIAQQLTAVPGSSEVFIGGAVVYSEKMKSAWVGVPPGVLARHTAVSRETAEAMAEGVRAACGTTHGLSVTGYAGPGGGTREDPVGTVYCALSAPGVPTRCERISVTGDRDRVRLFAASHTLEMLRQHLLAASATP